MHKDDAALVRHLFAVAMGKLEDGTIVAARGQTSALSSRVAVREARQLCVIAHDVAAITGAILAVTHTVDTTTPNRSRKAR